jgi:hypothetical protein
MAMLVGRSMATSRTDIPSWSKNLTLGQSSGKPVFWSGKRPSRTNMVETEKEDGTVPAVTGILGDEKNTSGPGMDQQKIN